MNSALCDITTSTVHFSQSLELMLTSAAAKWPSRHFHAHIKQEVPLSPPPPPLHSSSFFSSPHFFLSLPPLFLPPSVALAASSKLLPKEKSTSHDLCPRTCQRRSSHNILVKTLTLLGERLTDCCPGVENITRQRNILHRRLLKVTPCKIDSRGDVWRCFFCPRLRPQRLLYARIHQNFIY